MNTSSKLVAEMLKGQLSSSVVHKLRKFATWMRLPVAAQKSDLSVGLRR